MDEREVKRLEQRRQQLLASLRQVVDLLLMQGEVRYVLCVRLRDEKTQKVIMGMLTNMTYVDQNGTSVPATPGIIMDVILEAMLEGPDITGPAQAQMSKNPYKM